MPTFDGFIIGAPTGFVRGCTALMKMEMGEVTALLETCLARIRSCQDIEINSDAVKSLLYIIRSRTQASPKPSSVELASALDGNTVLNRDIIAAIATALEASDTISAVSQLVIPLLLVQHVVHTRL
jgi:hypothetical protein